jgi:hypothetical protein
MTSYRITFFKKLLSSDGHQFNCPQQQIDILNSASREQARDAAIQKFESLHRSEKWKGCADTIEIETIEAA